MSEHNESRIARKQQNESPYLIAAMSIADKLVKESVSTTTGVTWYGDDLHGDNKTTLSVIHGPIGSDLYSGSAGISWFLAHAAEYTGSKAYAKTAEAGLNFALDEAKEKLNIFSIALYGGALGVALAAVDAAGCLNRPDLQQSGVSLARLIAKQIIKQPEFLEYDLIGGIAGVVIGLLAVHRLCADPILLDACRIASTQLIKDKHSEWWGSSWYSQNVLGEAPALCGLGHGMSGIGWALTEMAWVTHEEHFLSTAKEAFQYERSWFSSELCAWPDLREYSKKSIQNQSWPGWTTAWCHGALGIGAVRLRIYEVTQDMTALAEASAAIQAARVFVARSGLSLSKGHISDVTLCHGLGGAVELFLLANEILGGDAHQRAARHSGDLCLANFKANDQEWSCGLQGAKQVPGLFLGLAGVGITMLRLHNPTLVGSPMLPGRSVKSKTPVSRK